MRQTQDKSKQNMI